MLTESRPDQRRADVLRQYTDHVVNCFGPGRMIYGSDWPVCLLAGSWKETVAAFTQAIGAQPIEVREKLLGGTAQQFYRI